MEEFFTKLPKNILPRVQEILAEFSNLYKTHEKTFDDLEIIMGTTRKRSQARLELDALYKKLLKKALNGDEITQLIEISHDNNFENAKYFFLRIISNDIDNLDNESFTKKYNMENDLSEKELQEIDEQEKRLEELLS